jgi:hypothetical protein
MAEEIAEDPPIVLLVLDNKNALCHAFTTCCWTSTATSRKNVEPAPRLGLHPDSGGRPSVVSRGDLVGAKKELAAEGNLSDGDWVVCWRAEQKDAPPFPRP